MQNIYEKYLLIIGVSLFLTIPFLRCTKVSQIQNSNQEVIAFKEKLPTISFSKRVYNSKKITKEPHYFSSQIAFKQVWVYKRKKENDNYTFVWIINPTYTDFEELSKWKIGMILKPKNSADFKDEGLEKKGIKTMGVLTKPYLLDEEICIVLRNFEFKPKEINYIKFYLYSDEKKTNLKYWITEDVSLNL